MGKDPEILVDLTTARTAFEAEIMVQALESQGIPARAFTIAGSMLQWEAAMSQPMRIAVRRRDLEQARLALKSIRSDSVDLDWDEIDTGDRTEPTRQELEASGDVCRSCGYDLKEIFRPTICPECGADLRREQETAARPREGGAGWVVWIGLGLLIAAVLLYLF